MTAKNGIVPSNVNVELKNLEEKTNFTLMIKIESGNNYANSLTVNNGV
jgi:hypothetical protein